MLNKNNFIKINIINLIIINPFTNTLAKGFYD